MTGSPSSVTQPPLLGLLLPGILRPLPSPTQKCLSVPQMPAPSPKDFIPPSHGVLEVPPSVHHTGISQTLSSQGHSPHSPCVPQGCIPARGQCLAHARHSRREDWTEHPPALGQHRGTGTTFLSCLNQPKARQNPRNDDFQTMAIRHFRKVISEREEKCPSSLPRKRFQAMMKEESTRAMPARLGA